MSGMSPASLPALRTQAAAEAAAADHAATPPQQGDWHTLGTSTTQGPYAFS
jgi:hypothetical protein